MSENKNLQINTLCVDDILFHNTKQIHYDNLVDHAYRTGSTKKLKKPVKGSPAYKAAVDQFNYDLDNSLI